MSKVSENFEQLIMRIHEVLESEDAIITWDDKIEDPENPKQLRQIDVTIRHNQMFNIVECRIHKEKQNVKWIEEIIGRKISLNADTAIAVSANGFTEGAIKKANKYGIILFDLLKLTDDDIKSWTKAINIQLHCIRYTDFKLNFVFKDEDLNNIDVSNMQLDFKKYFDVEQVFSNTLGYIESKSNLLAKENRDKGISFKTNFALNNFTIDKKEVKSIQATGKAYLETINLNLLENLSYGVASEKTIERPIIVQKYNLGQTHIIHKGSDISILIDLSLLELPPFWQFRYITIKDGGIHKIDQFEIMDFRKLTMNIDKVSLSISNVPLFDVDNLDYNN